MKRLSHSQLQNLIFIGVVMLVAAVAIVYLMLREDPTRASSMESAATSAPALTPSQDEEPLRFESVPISVLLAQLNGDKRLIVTALSENEYDIRLSSEEESAAAVLRLTESNGRISSLLWTFPLPEKPPDKPKNDIEKRLAESYEQQMSALRDRIETILTACISGSDLNDKLLEPNLRAWFEGALGTLDGGGSYRNVAEGCTFTAYASESDGRGALICALLLA